MINSIVTIDPDIQSGITVFTGTRVPIKSFFDYISSGESIETYLQDYPYVHKEQIYSLIAFLGNCFEKSTHTFLNENPA